MKTDLFQHELLQYLKLQNGHYHETYHEHEQIHYPLYDYGAQQFIERNLFLAAKRTASRYLSQTRNGKVGKIPEHQSPKSVLQLGFVSEAMHQHVPAHGTAQVSQHRNHERQQYPRKVGILYFVSNGIQVLPMKLKIHQSDTDGKQQQVFYGTEDLLFQDLPDKMIVHIRKHHRRLKAFRLLKIHDAVRDDDDHIAHIHFSGCRPIEADDARTAFALYDISLQPFAVVHVHDLHFFVFNHIGGIHQVLVDGDAAHIIQFGLGNFYPMNLGFKNFYLHIVGKIRKKADYQPHPPKSTFHPTPTHN